MLKNLSTEILATKDLIQILTGVNKSFIKRVSKIQEEKYGNIDIFDAIICRGDDSVQIGFGEYWIRFSFANNKIFDTLGTGQGHKYHQSLEKCAIELHKKFMEV